MKIVLLPDDQLSIQVLFCKIEQDRLYKRLRGDVNTLQWNTAVSRIVSPVVENMEAKGSY